ncbi:hypothetical protein HT136_12920 [Novosphingobium profundi]|uniref:hypothetical protein n=1 Tax=Novosphingobium profundi TaxID=1774954 RepID=UPI001BDB007C|nr:hypothetical protein [Novosphingobium profundi]MBT0669266.1 hypothetical protein [Novosphingobium profundi]
MDQDLEADRTACGKPHFEVLDGLRGTAAMRVVLFHIQGITAAWTAARFRDELLRRRLRATFPSRRLDHAALSPLLLTFQANRDAR